jgi:predicted ester cyclase
MIAVHANWNGTNSGPLMGKPASGKPVAFVGMVMWRFNAKGLIDRRWTQMDMARIFAQL